MLYLTYNKDVVDISFFKKFKFPEISFKTWGGKPSRVVGVDIGGYSTKIVQLHYYQEKAILETYGELINAGYFKDGEAKMSGGFLRFSDSAIISILKDTLKESNVTTKDAVIAIPASSSFMTMISLPPVLKKEVAQAIPYEARKYIPIPLSEVALDWEILESNENSDNLTVLIVAVPREVIDKFKRVAKSADLNARALEIETFSLIRSLIGHDPTPTAIINIGHLSTTFSVVDRIQLRTSRNLGHGSRDITKTLQRGLSVNLERAESMKIEIGLSDRIEDREISSIITPIVETSLDEIERNIALYNRKSSRKIQKVNLTGGGSNLKGIVEYTASKLGLEVIKGNPFNRITTPAYMQPILKEIGPGFSVAVGLAMREITAKI